MDLQKLIAKMDQIEAKGIVEAGDPEGYAQAQAAMARLEKAAKYTGDDTIVRGRMGLPPKLPPIEQWDGKMPVPTGKPDWISRLTTLGGSTDAQAQAAAVNTAEKGALDQSNASLKQIADLTAKLNAMAMATAPTKEGISFKSMMAKQLTESFGYNMSEEGEDKQAIIKQLQNLTSGFRDTEDEKILAVVSAADEAIKKAQASATTTPGQTATPTPGGPSSQDLTGAAGAAGEEVGKKLQRYKELLAKASGKTAPTQTATPKPPAAAGANPLAADPITANAKPKTEARLSEAEKYAALRDRVLMIEARDDVQDQETDEGIADLARGAWNVGKNFAGGLGGKMAQGTTKTAAELAASQAATNAARVAAGKKALSAAQLAQQAKVGIGANNAATGAAKFANRAGTAIAKNPVKTAVAATAAGAAAGYGLSGGAEKKPEDNKPVVPPKPGVLPPKVPGQTATPVPGGLTPEEMKELDALAQSFGDSEDEEIAGLNKQYGDVKNALMNAKK